jgi:hypothetical protein
VRQKPHSTRAAQKRCRPGVFAQSHAKAQAHAQRVARRPFARVAIRRIQPTSQRIAKPKRVSKQQPEPERIVEQVAEPAAECSATVAERVSKPGCARNGPAARVTEHHDTRRRDDDTRRRWGPAAAALHCVHVAQRLAKWVVVQLKPHKCASTAIAVATSVVPLS